jgi:hypothetical protein
LLLPAVALSAACTAQPKGALILAVSTDMQAPKDVDVVSIYVETAGVPKFNYLGRVLPDGSVSLPSTLAIVEPDDPTAQVRIRVIMFQTQSSGNAIARVMRDVVTTVPDGHTGLLRMPLNFLDDGSAAGTLPASQVPNPAGASPVPEGETMFQPADPIPTDPGYIKPTCDFSQNLTSVAGQCVDANVDSTKVPEYSDDLVYGTGGTPDNAQCFPVDQCLSQATAVAMTTITMAADGSCSFPIQAGETGQNWNCALQTMDQKHTGRCVGPNGGPPCYVPLESDPGEGFTVQPGKAVVMVPGVCSKLMNGTAQLVVDKTSCATKVEATPVCQPGATGMTMAPAADGGVASQDAAAVFADSGTAAREAGGGDASAATDSGTFGGSDASFTGPDTGAAPQDGGATVSDAPGD